MKCKEMKVFLFLLCTYSVAGATLKNRLAFFPFELGEQQEEEVLFFNRMLGSYSYSSSRSSSSSSSKSSSSSGSSSSSSSSSSSDDKKKTTSFPTFLPTFQPTVIPTISPTVKVTDTPTFVPTESPTILPTSGPTNLPTIVPTTVPTSTPTSNPTITPTVSPTSIISVRSCTNTTPDDLSNMTQVPVAFQYSAETASNSTEFLSYLESEMRDTVASTVLDCDRRLSSERRLVASVKSVDFLPADRLSSDACTPQADGAVFCSVVDAGITLYVENAAELENTTVPNALSALKEAMDSNDFIVTSNTTSTIDLLKVNYLGPALEAPETFQINTGLDETNAKKRTNSGVIMAFIFVPLVIAAAAVIIPKKRNAGKNLDLSDHGSHASSGGTAESNHADIDFEFGQEEARNARSNHLKGSIYTPDEDDTTMSSMSQTVGRLGISPSSASTESLADGNSPTLQCNDWKGSFSIANTYP